MTKCKDDECKITVSEEKYEQLRKDLENILVPYPDQRKPTSLIYKSQKLALDKIMLIVRTFIVSRLTEYMEEKK